MMIRSISKIVLCLVAFQLVASIGCYSQTVSNISDEGIAYTVAGDGDLLVFIHGSNLDHRMWESQVKYFSQDFKVLTYDQRGLGSSRIPSETYSNASDLANLLEYIGESDATLIGLSAGAQVALEVALMRPEIVAKLILVSPSLNGFTPKQMPSYVSSLVAALRGGDYERANEVLLDSPIMSVTARYEELVRDMVVSSNQWKLPYELIQQPPEPVTSNLGKIDVPGLILLGGQDIPAINEVGGFLHDEVPNADMVVIPEGKHLLNLSNPDAFNNEVKEFVGLDQ